MYAEYNLTNIRLFLWPKTPSDSRGVKLVSQFRRWSEFTGGTSEKLDAGTFKESGTNVSARLFTVRKT